MDLMQSDTVCICRADGNSYLLFAHVPGPALLSWVSLDTSKIAPWASFLSWLPAE